MESQNLMISVQQTLQKSISHAIKKEFGIKATPKVVSSNRSDYQSGIVMELQKQFKSHQTEVEVSQMEILEKIINSVSENPIIHQIKPSENKSNLFLNVTIKDEFIGKEILKIARHGINYHAHEKEKVLVDFSGPNIAKDLHVGNFRSTIIGDVTSSILESLDHEVLRLNHIGDWGRQFGLVTAYLFEKYPNYLVYQPNISELTLFYQEATVKFDADDDFKKKCRDNVVQLQKEDPKVIEAWKWICDLSRKDLNQIYERLHVRSEELGESFYKPMIPPMIDNLMKEGHAIVDNGAKCIFIDGLRIPCMIQKTDGGYNYDTTDLAAINYRVNQLKCSRLIYITDIGQQLHFKIVFGAAKKVGYYSEAKTKIEHYGFGLVIGESGKKIRTREKVTVKLIDLLNNGHKVAKELIHKRNYDKNKEFEVSQIEQDAENLGIGSIKYFELNRRRTSNYLFDYKKMLQHKGNCALYIFYQYARILFITKKIGTQLRDSINEIQFLTFQNPFERKLALCLLKYPEIIDNSLNNIRLNILTEYTYELSRMISKFYKNCQVIGDERQSQRIILVEASKKMLEKIFKIIGIIPLENI